MSSCATYRRSGPSSACSAPSVCCCSFFFQAEDGIRDLTVTGVQTCALPIYADIADAVRRYLAATEDEEFERGPGLELLVATARLWRSLGHHDARGGFRIDRV